MIKEDTDDCGLSDCWDYPSARSAAVRAPFTGNLDQSIQVNKALPWVALACLFGGLGFGGLIVMSLLMPQYVRSEVRASSAELQAQFSEQMAEIRVEARNASSISEVWRNRVNKLEAEANANRRR